MWACLPYLSLSRHNLAFFYLARPPPFLSRIILLLSLLGPSPLLPHDSGSRLCCPRVSLPHWGQLLTSSYSAFSRSPGGCTLACVASPGGLAPSGSLIDHPTLRRQGIRGCCWLKSYTQNRDMHAKSTTLRRELLQNLWHCTFERSDRVPSSAHLSVPYENERQHKGGLSWIGKARCRMAVCAGI